MRKTPHRDLKAKGRLKVSFSPSLETPRAVTGEVLLSDEQHGDGACDTRFPAELWHDRGKGTAQGKQRAKQRAKQRVKQRASEEPTGTPEISEPKARWCMASAAPWFSKTRWRRIV